MMNTPLRFETIHWQEDILETKPDYVRGAKPQSSETGDVMICTVCFDLLTNEDRFADMLEARDVIVGLTREEQEENERTLLENS